LAGDTLIYCTHAGTIAAVDVRTGKPVWALRYPRPARGWPGPPPQRDLCPAVADNGRVFAAPHDSDQLFALDAGTGRVLWQAGPLAVDQLLGVTRGKLIATVSRPTPGIRGLDVATGSDRGPSGWATHDDAALRSFGRGLVADNLILWPTGDSQNAVLVLDPHTGRPAGRPPLRPPAGNLAFADGVLLVGTPAGLAGYVTDAFRGNPAIPPPPSGDDRNRAVDLINLAERALERGDMKSAEATLRDLIRREFPTTWRVRAAGRLLSLQPPGGGRDAADRFLVSLGQKAEFADGWLNPADGPPARLRELVRRHFGVPDPPPRSPPPVAPAATPPPAELDPQLPISKTVTFPTVCRPLLAMDGGPDLPGLRPDAGSSPLLFVTDGPRVLAYHPGAASPGWTTPLPDGLVVDRARVVGPALYLVGRHGAAKLSAADGKLLWWFAVPDTDPLPGPHPRPSPGINSYPLPALADPAVCGRRLIARLGDGHLVGLDLVTGSISWVLDGRGRNGYSPYPLPSVPRFTHLWAASATLAVARTSAGERVLLDPDTGAVKDVSPTSPLPWAGPPARLANGFVVADGAAELTALSGPETGLWAADFGREASLTGKPPQLLSLADGVLAAVSRNHGVELERVQAAGGTRPWPDGPTFLSTAGGDLSAAAVGESLLYVPVDGTLTAVRLADGRHAWSVPLPGDPQSTWQVRVGRTAVFARPTRVPEGLEWAKAAGRLARWPAVWRLPALAAGAYDAWATGTVPLLAFDPDSGRRLARLDLPAAGGEAAVSLGRHPVVVTARRAYWLKPS
jgi:outer membrane protein assembly factor BamB